MQSLFPGETLGHAALTNELLSAWMLWRTQQGMESS